MNGEGAYITSHGALLAITRMRIESQPRSQEGDRPWQQGQLKPFSSVPEWLRYRTRIPEFPG